MLSEETRLDQRLSKLRLEMFVMAGDGNCQVSFLGLSCQIRGERAWNFFCMQGRYDATTACVARGLP